MNVVREVQQFIIRHGLIPRDHAVVIGVSGGVDSLVLLHVLCALSANWGWRLHVATLDHGIRGADSAADAVFVRETAETWRVPVTVGQVDVPTWAAETGQGLEAAARHARYAFLQRVARSAGASRIAVGHNQDDQAETILLHVVRGSGLNGLGGMRPATPVSELTGEIPPPFPDPGGMPAIPPAAELVTVVRPLLAIPRAAIEAYADQHELQPRQDATNQDQAYTRNRVRHAVIPLLETLNPDVKAALARLATLVQADADLVAEVGQRALDRVVRVVSSDRLALDRAAWDTLSVAEQRYVIRAAICVVRPVGDNLAFEHVDHALAVAARGQTGSAVTLPGGLELRIERDTLTLAPAGTSVLVTDAPGLPAGYAGESLTVGMLVEQVFGGWTFTVGPLALADDLPAIHADPLAAALAVPEGAKLVLRTRLVGDRFRPRGMGGRSQKLSDTLTNLHVPAPWRDHVPLLVIEVPGRSPEIAWFVAPTSIGVRGRVAETFAIHERNRKDMIVVLRWCSIC